jgi:hypothetical protein
MSNQSAHELSKIETEAMLRQLNDDWVKALVRRDGAALDRIMANDFLFAYPLEGDDKEEFINEVVSGDLVVEHINRDNVSVRIWGGTAVLTAKDSAKWFYRGREWTGHYKIIQVYSCREDEWKLVAVQACHIQ